MRAGYQVTYFEKGLAVTSAPSARVKKIQRSVKISSRKLRASCNFVTECFRGIMALCVGPAPAIRFSLFK